MGPRHLACMISTECAALAERTSCAEIVARRISFAVHDVALMMQTSAQRGRRWATHEAVVRKSVLVGRPRFCFQPTDRMWGPLPMLHMGAILPLSGVIDAGASRYRSAPPSGVVAAVSGGGWAVTLHARLRDEKVVRRV